MSRYQHGSPDPLSLPVSIVHCYLEVFKAISCIGTHILSIGSCWSSCLFTSTWWGPQEYIAYKFVLNSPAVPRISGSSNFDSFRDEWLVAVQLLFCGVLSTSHTHVHDKKAWKTVTVKWKKYRFLWKLTLFACVIVLFVSLHGSV